MESDDFTNNRNWTVFRALSTCKHENKNVALVNLCKPVSCWASANIERWQQTVLKSCKKIKPKAKDKYGICRHSSKKPLSNIIYSIVALAVSQQILLYEEQAINFPLPDVYFKKKERKRLSSFSL